MSDSPILILQSFFPYTICTLMVVDVNTSYGTQNKDYIKNTFKAMNWVNRIDDLATITKNICILYRKFCFALFMLYLS